LLIIPKKPELSKEERNDQDDDLVTKNEDAQPKEKFPNPEGVFIESHPCSDAAGDPGGGGTGNGKCAEDEEELTGPHIPFLLQFVEHAAKRRKKRIQKPFSTL
jgi:hypothetical protein